MSTNNQAEFPMVFRDFVKMFPDVAACASYLERLRWPDGFVCLVCQNRQELIGHVGRSGNGTMPFDEKFYEKKFPNSIKFNNL